MVGGSVHVLAVCINTNMVGDSVHVLAVCIDKNVVGGSHAFCVH